MHTMTKRQGKSETIDVSSWSASLRFGDGFLAGVTGNNVITALTRDKRQLSGVGYDLSRHRCDVDDAFLTER
jgi:hypothetical protein